MGSWVQQFQKACKTKKVPVFVGLVNNDLRLGPPKDFIYIDHGYWNRSKQFRIIRAGLHLKEQLDRPADRLEGTEMRPWRRDGSFIVVIPPSEYQAGIYPEARRWVSDLRLKTDREIRVKQDKHLPFEPYLQGAWAVVSYGSVAAVKAAMWGFPVLSGPHCPATPISCEDIESPVLKDREPWLRSLSYAQWTFDEARELDLDNYAYARRNDLP